MSALQAVPLPHRPTTFRDRGMAALEHHEGADLVGYLAMLHDQDMAEVVEQAVAARTALAQMASGAAIDQQMLASILEVVQPMMRGRAEDAARAGHFSGIVESLRALVRQSESDGTAVDHDQLRQIIDVPATPPPFRPLVLAFRPSSHYRVGHFRQVTTNAEFHLPFAGYTLCEEHPERPMLIHVSFLHKAVVRPQPQLYAEHGLVMEHLE